MKIALFEHEHSTRNTVLVVTTTYYKAMPWLKRLVAGLSPWRPGFAPRSIHMGFVVDKEALGQFFLQVLQLSPVNIIPPSLSKLISSGG
jgi:hypothetical protein